MGPWKALMFFTSLICTPAFFITSKSLFSFSTSRRRWAWQASRIVSSASFWMSAGRPWYFLRFMNHAMGGYECRVSE